MPGVKTNINITILIAPLDWGLGHTTRCIPIIKYLLEKQCRVIVATSGFHEILLKREFNELECIYLSGYDIKYAKKNILFRLFLQIPHILKNIRREHNWLNDVIEQYKIDAVISDNRYGLFTSKVPCVFITHQLQIKVPQIWRWIDGKLRNKIYNYINNFSECWVPDAPGKNESLAALLSHPEILPSVPIHYIGWLSRFTKSPVFVKKYIASICLSGPEPQRSVLENILLPQLQLLNEKFLLIRGMPGETSLPTLPQNITVINHLSTPEMQQALIESHYIISRSGYSTLMDMKVLQCKCIYIPTPGQTEQEYLGKSLAAKNIALVKQQHNFNLEASLKEAMNFKYSTDTEYSNSMMEKVIDSWLMTLHKQ